MLPARPVRARSVSDGVKLKNSRTIPADYIPITMPIGIVRGYLRNEVCGTLGAADSGTFTS